MLIREKSDFKSCYCIEPGVYLSNSSTLTQKDESFWDNYNAIKERYSGEKFARAISEIHGASVEVVKRNELHQFKVLPKRWIVERTFAWLEKCRRLWKNCERKLLSSLAMTTLAFVALLLRRF